MVSNTLSRKISKQSKSFWQPYDAKSNSRHDSIWFQGDRDLFLHNDWLKHQVSESLWEVRLEWLPKPTRVWWRWPYANWLGKATPSKNFPWWCLSVRRRSWQKWVRQKSGTIRQLDFYLSVTKREDSECSNRKLPGGRLIYIIINDTFINLPKTSYPSISPNFFQINLINSCIHESGRGFGVLGKKRS